MNSFNTKPSDPRIRGHGAIGIQSIESSRTIQTTSTRPSYYQYIKTGSSETSSSSSFPTLLSSPILSGTSSSSGLTGSTSVFSYSQSQTYTQPQSYSHSQSYTQFSYPQQSSYSTHPTYPSYHQHSTQTYQPSYSQTTSQDELIVKLQTELASKNRQILILQDEISRLRNVLSDKTFPRYQSFNKQTSGEQRGYTRNRSRSRDRFTDRGSDRERRFRSRSRERNYDGRRERDHKFFKDGFSTFPNYEDKPRSKSQEPLRNAIEPVEK